ncbi:MAG: type IV pilus biogenesis protein PilM [Phycisphaerae bacterium]
MPAWLKKLGPRRFVAVDWDRDAFRVVEAEQASGKPKITRLASVPISTKIDLDDAQAVGRALGGALKDLRLAGEPVVMNIPRGQAVLKPMALPPGTAREEMAAMVRYQVEEDLPFPAEEAVIDFTVTRSHFDVDDNQTGDTEAGENVLVAAARLPVVDYYRQVAEAAGVKLHRLGLRPYANLRCIEACTVRGPDESVALVQVLADETEIDVMVGPSLAFSRSAMNPSGGRPHPDSDEGRRAVHTVVTEVIRSLQSFSAIERGKSVDAILVAGGTGIEKTVTEVLAERTGVQVELLDPAGGFRLRPGESHSEFVSALGLAAGSCEQELPFDFINPKQPVIKKDHRRTTILAGAAGLVLLIAAIIPLQNRFLAPKRSLRAELYRQAQTLKKKVKRTKTLPKQYAEVRDFLEPSYNWPKHLAALSMLLPPADEAYLPGGLRTSDDGSVRFTVRTRQVQTIGKLTENLQRAGYQIKMGRSGVVDRDPFGYYNNYEVTVYVTDESPGEMTRALAVGRPEGDAAAKLLTSPEGFRRWREHIKKRGGR